MDIGDACAFPPGHLQKQSSLASTTSQRRHFQRGAPPQQPQEKGALTPSAPGETSLNGRSTPQDPLRKKSNARAGAALVSLQAGPCAMSSGCKPTLFPQGVERLGETWCSTRPPNNRAGALPGAPQRALQDTRSPHASETALACPQGPGAPNTSHR